VDRRRDEKRGAHVPPYPFTQRLRSTLTLVPRFTLDQPIALSPIASEDHHKHYPCSVTCFEIGRLNRVLPRCPCYRPIDVGKHLPLALLAECGYLVARGRAGQRRCTAEQQSRRTLPWGKSQPLYRTSLHICQAMDKRISDTVSEGETERDVQR
jgi:hypothetical protein